MTPTPTDPTTHLPSAGGWGLFVDWCAASRRSPLPADTATLAAFVAECPAGPATIRRRLAAIRRAHVAAGLPAPGVDEATRLAAGGAPTAPGPDPETVRAALVRLPAYGWTGGWFGRRDAALLVLSQTARIPYTRIATLTLADLVIADGTATVDGSTGGPVRLVRADDPATCPACVLSRWGRALHLAVTHPSTRTLAQALTPEDPSTGHICHRGWACDEAVPLIPPITGWGDLALDHAPLGTDSQGRITTAMLTGRAPTRRDLPITPKPDLREPEPASDAPDPGPAAAYGPEQWHTGMQRRRADRQTARDIDRRLEDLENRVAQLQRRAAELLRAT